MFEETISEAAIVLNLFSSWSALKQQLVNASQLASPLSRFVETRFTFVFLALWKLVRSREALIEVLNSRSAREQVRTRAEAEKRQFTSAARTVASDAFWLRVECVLGVDAWRSRVCATRSVISPTQFRARDERARRSCRATG